MYGNFRIYILELLFQIRVAAYCVEPFHVVIIFAMITAIRYGLELKVVLCTDGEDLKNLNLDSLLRTPKSNEDQNPSGWSGTPPSGKNFDPGLKSVDSDAKLTSGSEEKSSLGIKAQAKQNSTVNNEYDFISKELKVDKKEQTLLDLQTERYAENANSKPEPSVKKDPCMSLPWFSETDNK